MDLFSLLCCVVFLSIIFWFVFVRRYTFGHDNQPVTVKDRRTVPVYNLNEVYTPAVYGMIARILERLYTTLFGHIFILPMVLRKSGLDMFRSQSIEEWATLLPIVESKEKTGTSNLQSLNLWDYVKPREKETDDFQFLTISDLLEMYRSKKVTPLEVAERAIQAIRASEKSTPPMNIFVDYHEEDILRMAKESTLRYKNGTPLTVFDGIPVSAKDNFRILGCVIRDGTSIVNMHTDSEDLEAVTVNKLRKGGAIILGVTNMHPLGLGVLGYNGSRFHGTSRNPYNVNFSAFGSSSGASASVAAGINLMALGMDGGGSVRLPAAACGLVGVKATYGRISIHNTMAEYFSVCNAGPLTGTVRDAALSYAYLAGPDEHYAPKRIPSKKGEEHFNMFRPFLRTYRLACQLTSPSYWEKSDSLQRLLFPAPPDGLGQPAVTLENFDNLDLSGFKLGIDWTYFKDCNADVMEECMKAVTFLETERNAEIVPINIPELKENQIAHFITIITEAMTVGKDLYLNHFDSLACDNQMTLTAGSALTAVDFLMAQKQKTRAISALKEIFEKVDCILTPGAPMTPPELVPGAFSTGLCDSGTSSFIMKYAFLGNLTGIPCMVLPVGYGKNGLPLSLQICTPWYEEAVMFRIGHATEDFFKLRKRPQVYFNIA